jgi:hypothetical protein
MDTAKTAHARIGNLTSNYAQVHSAELRLVADVAELPTNRCGGASLESRFEPQQPRSQRCKVPSESFRSVAMVAMRRY